MKLLLRMFIIISLVLMSTMAFCQEVLPVTTNEDFIKWVIATIGALKGASPYVIAGIVVELILKIFSTEMFGFMFKKLKGHVKLTIVLSLSYVAGVIALLISGETWMASLMNAASISAFLVLFNQIYKQYIVKKD